MSKYHKKNDPHHSREAEHYANPVPSREYILEYLEECAEPVPLQQLIDAFKLDKEEEYEGLRARLRAMERDGQLMRNRRNAYALVDQLNLVRGRVQGHRDGFGFLIPDDGGADIFLPAREMRQVFTDDVVLVRVTGGTARRREGAIIEVLEHNTHQVVGRYFEEKGVAFVDPDHKAITQDIIIPHGQQGAAKHGQFVVAEIVSLPTNRRQPTGKVIEVLGDQLTPGMEVELAIRSHQLPFQWPDDVLQESQRLPAEVPEIDKEGRLDLRSLSFVTIDGEDAKDFDDAVYCTNNNFGGWTLYVAIADVSHYIRVGSYLDEHAQLRGNSVYFPTKVIPMLPEILSNGLCSLKPKQDRLVMVCKMEIDESGMIQHYEFHDAVIHSKARLTYTEVAAMLRGEKTEHVELYPHLKNLDDLYKKLLKQREFRGAIEFETTETKIEFDEKGKIKQIKPSIRNEAHRIIEEMMLAANVSAARFLEKANIPTLYRVHEGPDPQRLLSLKEFLKALGLKLTGGDKPTSMDYAKLLAKIEKRPDAQLLQTVMLRSLQQAVYRPKNVGHFGLSYDRYCHFTSPIRRYPDLLVHRALKSLIHHHPVKKFTYTETNMQTLGEHCSMTERRADRATRDAVDWLKCEYLLDKVGESYSGRIIEVTNFGIFVELESVFVQGLVHVTSLPNDYYQYDAVHHLLRGKRSGKTYRLGDPIRVTVSRVNLDDRKIDFDLA